MIHKIIGVVSLLLVSTLYTIGRCEELDINIDTMTLVDLQEIAVKNASSIKLMRNQIKNGEIDLRQQSFIYWAIPQVNLGFSVDTDERRVTTIPSVGVNLDRFFFRGRDDRKRAQIRLSDFSILIDREMSLIRIDVKNRYNNYLLLKQKVENLKKNKQNLDEMLIKFQHNKNSEQTGFALLTQQQSQLIDSVYQSELELSQKKNDLISVIEGNR